MKYYILDDDINIVKILRNIIEEDFDRRVIGFGTDPKEAVDEILLNRPDVVLVDYLMPGYDGVDVIKKIKSVISDIEFIMISQVSDKAMIGEAYGEGLSFFISKPINKIEVDVILGNMEDRIKTSRKLNQIIHLIGDSEKNEPMINRYEIAKSVLKDLGIYSEKGSKDMIAIIEMMQSDELDISEAFENYCKAYHEKPKIIRQRMRRSMSKGLRNLAYLGIEDYMNELFVKYSNSLYDFETVKREMDYIRGTNKNRGTISIDKFLESLNEF